MAYQPPIAFSNTYQDFNKKLNLPKKNDNLLDLDFGASDKSFDKIVKNPSGP
jgi:hypothetical protein